MLRCHVKFVQTDRRMDGQTTVKQYVPDLSIRGHKNGLFRKALFNCMCMYFFFFLKTHLVKALKKLD